MPDGAAGRLEGKLGRGTGRDIERRAQSGYVPPIGASSCQFLLTDKSTRSGEPAMPFRSRPMVAEAFMVGTVAPSGDVGWPINVVCPRVAAASTLSPAGRTQAIAPRAAPASCGMVWPYVSPSARGGAASDAEAHTGAQ